MRVAAALAVVACVSAASAQTVFCGTGSPCPDFLSPKSRDDGTDLGRAMDICERHANPVTLFYPEGGHPHPGYREGWEACGKVRAAWERSAAAMRERELEEQERRDKAFVEGVAARE